MNGNDWLMGVPRDPVVSWKDRPIGWSVSGEILPVGDGEAGEWVQRRDDDGELEWWDDERTQPKMQLIIHLKTGVIKPDHEDHKGVWRLFVASKGLKDAVKAAVLKSGAKKLQPGGKLTVEYAGEGQKAPTAKKTHSAPKMFKATYTPPADAFMNEKPKASVGAEEPPF